MKVKALFLMLAVAASFSLTSCLENGNADEATPRAGCGSHTSPVTPTDTTTTTTTNTPAVGTT